jgi:hypothetical protein
LGAIGLALCVLAVVMAVVGLGGESDLGFKRTFFDSTRSTADPATYNIEVEREWPEKMAPSDSKPVRLALILNSGGPASTPGSTGISRSQVPLPEGYAFSCANARLVGASFEIQEATDEVQCAEGRDRLEWVWNLAPEREGKQTVNLNLALELHSAANDGPKRPEWTDSLEIDISVPDESLMRKIGRVPIASPLMFFLGSALSIPFLYTIWRDRPFSKRGADS